MKLKRLKKTLSAMEFNDDELFIYICKISFLLLPLCHDKDRNIPVLFFSSKSLKKKINEMYAKTRCLTCIQK